MNIILDGVKEEDRDLVKAFIEEIVDMVLDDLNRKYLKEIIIPTNYQETIIKINETGNNDGAYSDSLGTTIELNNYQWIVIDNNLFINGILSENEEQLYNQYMIIAHELNHVKANCINKQVKLNHMEENQKNFYIVGKTLWDEYYAQKGTVKYYYNKAQIQKFFIDFLQLTLEHNKIVKNSSNNVKSDYFHGYICKLGMLLGTIDGLICESDNKYKSLEEILNICCPEFITYLQELKEPFFICLEKVWEIVRRNPSRLPNQEEIISVGQVCYLLINIIVGSR